MRDKVAIIKLEDYDNININNALSSIVQLLDLKTLFHHKSVLLKPNLLAPTKYAYTPPELVSELTKILKEQVNTKEIIVGDSTMTRTFTNLTFQLAKYKDICHINNIKLLNFFEDERLKITLTKPEADIEKNMYLPKSAIVADFIINLPKLKTHNGYVYTGAIKNLFGLLGNKMNMHKTHKNKTDFQKMLADIYFAVEETNKTDFPKILTIMDAVIAMEGRGPRAGKPRKVGLIIAGFNPAVVDIIGYLLMNGNPEDLEVIKSIARRINLPIDISKIEFMGEQNIKNYIIKNFKKPNVSILKKDRIRKNAFYSKILEKLTKISIKINPKKCLLCEECVKHCPAEALFRKENKIFVNKDLCIECFCCGESCPNDAISAKFFIFRILPILFILFSLSTVLILWFLISFFSGLS
jgi:uncharacterized protein (DUF362 family)